MKTLDQSTIHEVFLSSHCSEEDRERFDELIIHKVRISKGIELYRAGDPSQYLYFVRRGSFKTTLVSEQGHSLVTGFTMSGEPMGLEVITGERHICTVSALEDSEVNLISCQRLANLARDIPVLQLNLNRMLSRELIRSQNMLITLGHCTAEERLAIFMLDLSRRFAVRGYSAHCFLLRMSREDIASFIGVRAETICRAIARLRALRLMTFEGRSVEIIDIPQLETFCQRG
ncbi:Crp/Fnr family transcriptional regulator [Pseudomonas nunensis]|nr:Crp/Fnr family transcriptional regulator [Pseudomonas nunensis]